MADSDRMQCGPGVSGALLGLDNFRRSHAVQEAKIASRATA
jgi:hypothetical protein